MSVKATQICVGRFHHFHLARQLERHGLLREIWTGYPRSRLKDEAGIPAAKIRSFPWLHTPFMLGDKFGLARWKWGFRELTWRSHQLLDHHVARNLGDTDVLIALSGSGLKSGRAIKQRGGHFVCDRGSSHIRYQDELLAGEYARWGLKFAGVDPRMIKKEEQEYELADVITVPSEFVRRSFLQRSVPAAKITKIPYGANLSRFSKTADPATGEFTVLFVGAVSIRKGFFDLLEAFARFKHPAKSLRVIGGIAEEIKPLLYRFDLAQVSFGGRVPNTKLSEVYSRAHVLVLPSIEEGLAMVMGEAQACGCPIIATTNTGGEDLFVDGDSGFVVPIRSPEIILQKLELLAQDPGLREKMSAAALERVKRLGGWDTYGDAHARQINKFGRLGSR